jgi:predicted transcriptional regulator
LPELLNDPAALLKSISVSNSFVVVLDAEDEKARQVLAIIKPEKNFNNIVSIHGRDNFKEFLERTNEAAAILSINKKKVIKDVDLASIQSRGGATFDDFQEPVYQQSKNLSSTKIDSKENIMAEIKIEDREEARGFVQGVCESAVVVAQKDKELSRKLLSELGVTKELSKKFAETETYKALQKDVFAPPKVEREQTLERGRGISR